MKASGFTLVELVMVIVITGILAATLTVFLKPAIDSYVDTRRRAELTNLADTALRRMAQDIRRAVPNSVRTGPGAFSKSCFQLVPTIAGGRYRMDSDTVNDSSAPCAPSATCSAPLDTTQATTAFDVLSPLDQIPSKDDWVVIDNQDTDSVYSGTNRAQVDSVLSPAGGMRVTDGRHRISVTSKQFPGDNGGGRFVVVANTEQTVFYSCIGKALYRTVAAFDTDPATACAQTSGAKVASDVTSCAFLYGPNQGATQQSGFVWMRIELSQENESVVLAYGVHVDNVP